MMFSDFQHFFSLFNLSHTSVDFTLLYEVHLSRISGPLKWGEGGGPTSYAFFFFFFFLLFLPSLFDFPFCSIAILLLFG